MKNILKHIVLVYLAFFMLLASVAIPYSAMTCNVSKTKSFTLLDNQFSCEKDDFHDSCTKVKIKETTKVALDKSACCLFENGIIEADAQLVISQTVEFQAILTYLELPKISIVNFANFTSNYPNISRIDITDKPVRILLQSFLC